MTEGCWKSFAVFKREFKSYFESPVAYVFLVFFLILAGFMTFAVSKLYERNVADLQPFFFWHPWLFLLLVPAATMGLWAEERRAGTIELLLTMPVTMLQTILGKFFAAWLFMSLAILLTFPMVVTVAYLGKPDLGVILCGYIGSIMMAGAYVSVGMLASSMARSQVVSFIVALVTCFLLLLAGWEPVTGFFLKWAPKLADVILSLRFIPHQVTDFLARCVAKSPEAVASLSFIPHYEAMTRGVLDIRDIAYYASLIVFMTFATHIVVDNRKSV